jgi:hypothetical protein
MDDEIRGSNAAMPPSSQTRDPVPEQFATIEAAGEFWDTHDLADYSDLTTEADVTFKLRRRRYLVALAPELAEQLAAEAHKRGLSSETLVNLWLSERLHASSAGG